jgi:hypothetical protein
VGYAPEVQISAFVTQFVGAMVLYSRGDNSEEGAQKKMMDEGFTIGLPECLLVSKVNVANPASRLGAAEIFSFMSSQPHSSCLAMIPEYF